MRLVLLDVCDKDPSMMNDGELACARNRIFEQLPGFPQEKIKIDYRKEVVLCDCGKNQPCNHYNGVLWIIRARIDL